LQEIRRCGDSVIVDLEEHEKALVKELVREMKMLLEADMAGRENDPVLQRLFPEAYEEEEDQQAFRDLIGGELLAVKLEALRSVETAVSQPGPMELGSDEIERWLSWLTDVRLAIGTRLDMTEEKMEAELDPRDPGSAALAVLHWLGWLQGSILDAIT